MAGERRTRKAAPNPPSSNVQSPFRRARPTPQQKKWGMKLECLGPLIPSAKGSAIVIGIYLFFLMFGYFQESIYQIGDSQSKFHFPIFLVFVLCISNVIVSALLLGGAGDFLLSMPIVNRVLQSSTVPRSKPSSSPWFLRRWFFGLDFFILKEVALSAVSYSLSMLCTNYALSHVNYPTQVLVKSAKCVPVIVGGTLLFKKKYPVYDWVCVVVVTSSLIVFNILKESAKSGHHVHPTTLGFGLLGLSLFCDALTGPRQDRLLAKVSLSATHLMFLTNVFGALITGVICFFLEGVQPLKFCERAPQVIPMIILFAISASFGQVCIFGALTAFGSLHLTLITTTRKFFTVLLSVLAFGHRISPTQWACVVMVFSALALQSVLSKKRPNKKD